MNEPLEPFFDVERVYREVAVMVRAYDFLYGISGAEDIAAKCEDRADLLKNGARPEDVTPKLPETLQVRGIADAIQNGLNGLPPTTSLS
ncbi:hypothetical protein HYW87_01900 [Candidatus Roizmanbacteria bacterium]|nr:hypothetical protein [Candidatus Roizmanbacteria bacterium]